MGKKGKKRPRADDGLEEVVEKGFSVRGPPVATTSGRLSGSVPNDEWQTTLRTWAAIAPLFAA